MKYERSTLYRSTRGAIDTLDALVWAPMVMALIGSVASTFPG